MAKIRKFRRRTDRIGLDDIEKAQYIFGIMVTYLDAENEEKLLSFYRNNRFHSLTPDKSHKHS